MKTSTLVIGAAVGGIVAYLLYQRYKQAQRAAAHPITIAPDSALLKPMRVNPALVTDATVLQ